MTQEWISEFKQVSELEWKTQLLKELKGDESKLAVADRIEEISYSTFHYPNLNKLNSTKLPIQRGFYKSSNHWRNGIQISTTNEVEANKKALHALMTGCDFIHFISSGNTNWKTVLNEIGLPYIHTSFTIENSEDLFALINVVGQDNLSFCSLDLPQNTLKNNEIKNLIKNNQLPVFQIDGFSFNQCGSNSVQELSFVLVNAHIALLKLLNIGLSVDQAAACIHFKMGVGSNYLIEIAKFRSLKILWANLIKAYNPEHNCSLNCQITAEIGWVNKSLRDPYTNLLRQTTEAMSAILGGIDRLIIHPYDACSTNGSGELAQRMAFNISNLLQDESYFDSVSDVFGGSYAVEILTTDVATKAWELFKEIDALPLESHKPKWRQLVQEKANQRIEMMKTSQTTFIGINKFSNPEKMESQWASPVSFDGLSFLRLETEI